MRAGLTVLGILIGVAAVVTVTGLASGASGEVGGQLDSFSANAIYDQPETTQSPARARKATGRLTESDGKAIAREAVSIAGVGLLSRDDRPGRLRRQERPDEPHRRRTSTTSRSASGRSARGRRWQESDELLKTKVCVLGATVATKLFGDASTRSAIRSASAGFPYRVIGVLEARGSVARSATTRTTAS